MLKFFFTYGTSKQFPYQGGWTEIDAPSKGVAQELFRVYHPDVNPGILNCSEIYPEEEFRTSKMLIRGNLGARCHEKISIEIIRLTRGGGTPNEGV